MTLALYTPKPFSPPPADHYADLDTVTDMYVAFALEQRRRLGPDRRWQTISERSGLT